MAARLSRGKIWKYLKRRTLELSDAVVHKGGEREAKTDQGFDPRVVRVMDRQKSRLSTYKPGSER